MEFTHIPVLFQETIDSLQIQPDGVYVDCTAGGGGHSKAILERLSENGTLIAIDRDPEAIEILQARLGKYPQARIVHDTFNHIGAILGETRADGILADLGVSSHQLDTAERGFSFHKDAPLDMRMSKTGLSAYDVVNTYSEAELARILFTYGEEKFAKSIARNIVKSPAEKPIATTFDLIAVIKQSMPQKAMRDAHPARR
ncbi:MAG: 16S rRNA (cytosine(1402)-N(4))-methyltransferase RsmH, partial [Ruminococcus sp.]|nr:16S rRNA (cytosine(1402)-N(4))-methyltransferase RsmH [Ruminococcus sp.]